jgi:hypothetical protein
MRTIVKLMAFTAGLGMSAAVAMAQSHPQAFGVWDSEGTFAGTWNGGGGFITTIDGNLMALPFQADKIPDGGIELVYTQPNCAGTAYIQHDMTETMLSGAVLDGTIYYPGPRMTVTQASIGFERTGVPNECSAISQVPVEVGPIMTARLPTFHLPFCVSPTRKECR